MSWLGSLISGLFGIGQTAANVASQSATNKTNMHIAQDTNKMNYLINEQNNQANRQLAEYEWSKNLEMWNLQNQYNTPSAQMQRLKDAGINPNLALGSVSSGTAATLPKYQAAQMQSAHMSPYQRAAIDFDFAGTAMQLMNMWQDYRQKDVNINYGRERTLTETANRLLKMRQDVRAEQLWRYDTQYRNKLLDKIDAEIDLTLKNAHKLSVDTAYKQKSLDTWNTTGVPVESRFGWASAFVGAIMDVINKKWGLKLPWSKN